MENQLHEVQQAMRNRWLLTTAGTSEAVNSGDTKVEVDMEAVMKESLNRMETNLVSNLKEYFKDCVKEMEGSLRANLQQDLHDSVKEMEGSLRANLQEDLYDTKGVQAIMVTMEQQFIEEVTSIKDGIINEVQGAKDEIIEELNDISKRSAAKETESKKEMLPHLFADALDVEPSHEPNVYDGMPDDVKSDVSCVCGIRREKCQKSLFILDPCGHLPYCKKCVDTLKSNYMTLPADVREEGFDLKCPHCTNHVRKAIRVIRVKNVE